MSGSNKGTLINYKIALVLLYDDRSVTLAFFPPWNRDDIECHDTQPGIEVKMWFSWQIFVCPHMAPTFKTAGGVVSTPRRQIYPSPKTRHPTSRYTHTPWPPSSLGGHRPNICQPAGLVCSVLAVVKTRMCVLMFPVNQNVKHYSLCYDWKSGGWYVRQIHHTVKRTQYSDCPILIVHLYVDEQVLMYTHLHTC